MSFFKFCKKLRIELILILAVFGITGRVRLEHWNTWDKLKRVPEAVNFQIYNGGCNVINIYIDEGKMIPECLKNLERVAQESSRLLFIYNKGERYYRNV